MANKIDKLRRVKLTGGHGYLGRAIAIRHGGHDFVILADSDEAVAHAWMAIGATYPPDTRMIYDGAVVSAAAAETLLAPSAEEAKP